MKDSIADTKIFDAANPNPDRILVVDDDPMILTMLKEILEPKGYFVETAEGSGDALEKLIDYTFHLILLDANMPGISGFELLKYCRKHHPNMEIIMMTGNPDIEAAISTVKDGAFDYLSKPFSIERLLERVKDAIHSQKQKEAALISESKHAGSTARNNMSGTPLPDYKIIRTLGSGTMGVVLLVEKDGIRYALKILRKSADEDTNRSRMERFFREADILSRIDHPNIVKIYRSGQPSDNDVPFILMEYIEGRPLTDLIKKELLTFDEKLDVIRQIATALAAIHAEGILHRDVKPGNILVTHDHVVKLSDFGIAKVADSSLTLTHEALGSPAYMPPEAFQPSYKIDGRSDIFSLGIIAYEMLTGCKPFHGDTVPEIMGSIQKVRPREPRKLVPNLPLPVQAILEHMLEKDPALRYANAMEIVDDLTTYLEHGTLRHRASPVKRLLRALHHNVWS